MLNVAYQAQAQLNLLSERERAAFDRLFKDTRRLQSEAKRLPESDRFVSLLGQDKRVVWRRTGEDITVLAIVAPAVYAA